MSGKDRVATTLNFKNDFYKKLKEKAEESGLSMAGYVRLCLSEKWKIEERGE